MAEENTKTVEASTDNLDEFNDLFEGRAKETVKEEENVETPEEEEPVEAEEDTDDVSQEADEESDDAINETAEQEDEEDDSGATEQEEDDSKPKGKKKNTVQERIDELTKARREAEREAEKWRILAEEREKRSQEKGKDAEDSETKEEPEAKAPNASDKDKYPLGDLDPQYQADMLDYKLEQRLAELDQKRTQEETERAQQARVEALQNEWNGKLEAAEETYEDFRETVQSLESAFEGVDPRHGQFIAETVMQMEKGPDVLYHLATNPEVTDAIIRSDPVNAALALGRLEATFQSPPSEKKAAPKQSKAPTPPRTLNKGTKTTLAVKPDTDDLDAFEDVFFDKK